MDKTRDIVVCGRRGLDESAESGEVEGRASMRAWRFVPEPEIRTTRRRGSVEVVNCGISEDMVTGEKEMVVWRELERVKYFCLSYL